MLKRTIVLHEDLLELLRKFPSSPAVLNPFSMSWRPLVGTIDISADVQQTIEWHKQAAIAATPRRLLEFVASSMCYLKQPATVPPVT